jgi:hypothetical protein
VVPQLYLDKKVMWKRVEDAYIFEQGTPPISHFPTNSYLCSMKAATITQLKKELETYTHQRLVETVIAAAKYKIENKELLSFILFDSDDIGGYVTDIKLEIDTAFDEIHNASFYVSVKRLRKILRLIQKYCKYIGAKEREVELLLHFCDRLLEHGYLRNRYKSLVVIYGRQLDKIEKLLPKIDEDLRFDYTERWQKLADVLY